MKKIAAYLLGAAVAAAPMLHPATARAAEPYNQIAKLTASDPGADDLFGVSVSVDGNIMAVGSKWDDDNAFNSGAVYVFERMAPGSPWTQTAKFVTDLNTAYQVFGHSVSVSGGTIVASILNENFFDGDRTGAVYVYDKGALGWSQTAKLKPDSGGEQSDNFGISVSIDGDTIVVGASEEDGNPSQYLAYGAAYVFEKGASGWSEAAKLTASDGANNDFFGLSVSIDGPTIAVGAQGNDGADTNTGAACVFEKGA